MLLSKRWKKEDTQCWRCFGQRYILRWSGNNSGIRGVRILVKEEECEKMADIWKKSDRVIVVVLTFAEKAIGVISAYGRQAVGAT